MQDTTELISIGEDEFDKTYEPIPGPDGSDWREHRDIPEDTPPEKVWTVVDGDDGENYILPGYHKVNYVARVVTKNPWPHEEIEVFCDAFKEE